MTRATIKPQAPKPRAIAKAPNPVPTVFVYVRYSSARQAEGTSFDRQMRVAHEIAAELGLGIEEVMFDRGMSGYTGANRLRGELGAFLARIEAGQIARGSVVVVENQDRLSRERTFVVLAMVEQFREAGIRVITADRRDLTSDEEMDELITVLDGQRSRRESGRKADLSIKTLIEKCERWQAGNYDFSAPGKLGGQIGGCRTPFWIKWNATAREYSLIPEKAEAVRTVIALYREGYGVGAIAQRLQEAGIWLTTDADGNPPADGLTSTIRALLPMPALMGVREMSVGKRQKDAGKIRHYRLENYYPALISSAEFASLQHIRQKRSNRSGEKSSLVSVLTGLQVIYCGFCGRSMCAQNNVARLNREQAKSGKSWRSHRRIYCSSYVDKTACPHRGTVHAHILEHAVLRTCADEFSLAHLMKIDARHDGLIARLARMHDELAELAGQRDTCERMVFKAKSEEQQEIWMDKQAQAIEAIGKKRKEIERIDNDLRAMEGNAEIATADVWETLIDGVLALDPDVRMTARRLVSDTFERISVYVDGYDGANHDIVNVELQSKRGGVISLQVDRKTGDARAKLVTRRKRAAIKAAV